MPTKKTRGASQVAPNPQVPGEIQNMATLALVQKVGESDADDIKRDLNVQKVIQSPSFYLSCGRTHIPHLPPLTSPAFSRT